MDFAATVDLDWDDQVSKMQLRMLDGENSHQSSWLNVIDEALCHLESGNYTSQVKQAHLIVQAILAGQLPVKGLLFPIFKTEPNHEEER